MVRGVLADINVQGHVKAIANVLQSEAWRDFWTYLNLPLLTFPDLWLPANTPDRHVWEVCQREQYVLITANRNDDGPDSLQATIRDSNAPDSLPVLTLADQERVLHSRDYAERVVERFLDYLLSIDDYRGTGRLFLP